MPDQDIQQMIIDIDTAAGPMAVLHTRPSAPTPRRVGIFFDAPGIRDATHSFSERLAAEGFEVIVPDLYHRDERLFHATPKMANADPSLRPRVQHLMTTLTDDGIQQDMADAMAGLGWDGPVGCIGFCLGARAVHQAMTRQPQLFVAGSMFHPSWLAPDRDDPPHLSLDRLVGPLHIGIGSDDDVQSIEMQQEYFDGVASMDNVDVKVFDGAGHGFTWPEYESTYHQEAADTCFAATVASFSQVL